MIAAHEALVAQWAQEAFLSCVGAGVAGKLIGAGKLLLAVRPGAREGSLTCSTEAEESRENHDPSLISNNLDLSHQLLITSINSRFNDNKRHVAAVGEQHTQIPLDAMCHVSYSDSI